MHNLVTISVLTLLLASIMLLFTPSLLFPKLTYFSLFSIWNVPGDASTHCLSTTSPPPMSSSSPNNANQVFTVHVFVNHEPHLASAFLPSLFSDFPMSAWRLPPRYNSSSLGYCDHEMVLDSQLRERLGRHVFTEPVPGSTTLSELSQSIEQQFGIRREVQAYFTIFPQGSRNISYEAKMLPKPLPPEMTISEARLLDEDASSLVYQPDVPVVYIVLETKAATLSRVIGGDFLQAVLGESRFFRTCNRLASFNIIFSIDEFELPKLIRALLRWRHATYALEYLRKKRGKLSSSKHDEEREMKDITRQVLEFQQDKLEARATISALAAQWTSWVLKQEFMGSIDAHNLPDEEVEATVQRIWRKKYEVINEWKRMPEKYQMLWEHRIVGPIKLKDNPHASKQHQTESTDTQTADGRDEEPEALDINSSLTPNLFSQVSRVETFPLRGADGTLLDGTSTFNVKSGILLWGQILPVYYATLQENFTNNAALLPDQRIAGVNNDYSFNYTFKSAARNGAWKVRRYYSDWRSPRSEIGIDGPIKEHAGWVVYHEDLNPLEIIRRVRAFESPRSLDSWEHNDTDKDVLRIEVQDWSEEWYIRTDPDLESKLHAYAEQNNSNGKLKSYVNKSQYFMALDAEGWSPEFVSVYKRDCDGKPESSFPGTEAGFKNTVERVFKKDGYAFGTYLRKKHGWFGRGYLVFSGEKHAEHDADELIAIIYDASLEYVGGLYHAVEADPGRPSDVITEQY